MGRKSSAKGNTPTPPPAKRGQSPILLISGLTAIALAIGITLYVRSTPTADADAAVAQRPAVAGELKPHQQANLPPLQFPAYPMARSTEVVTAAYRFAAEHPEVLSYVPCFCGCERSGHRGNEDCFVKTRDVNGDVVAWDEHGMECAVCLDVGLPGGITMRRRPPTFMPATPSSQPLITIPAPTGNEKGSFLVTELSNIVPLVKSPV